MVVPGSENPTQGLGNAKVRKTGMIIQLLDLSALASAQAPENGQSRHAPRRALLPLPRASGNNGDIGSRKSRGGALRIKALCATAGNKNEAFAPLSDRQSA
jgi:hypothetical protein